MDENNGRNYEHVVIQYSNGEIWIRRADDQEEEAEIISNQPGVSECLKQLAEKNPDVIDVIADDETQGVHAIVKRALHIEVLPATGDLSFIIEEEYKGNDA